MSSFFGRNNPNNEEELQQAMGEEQMQEQQEQQEEQREEAAPDKDDAPSLVDGWRIIERENLPFGGVYYPESWNFAYRCPTAKEVVNFSTVDNRDYASIYGAVEDIMKKCIKIFNSDTEKEVPIGEINDSDRYFFMTTLRDFYIPDEEQALKIKFICPVCFKESYQTIHPDKLIFEQPTDEILDAFDGRVFHLEMGDRTIVFRIPTIATSGRLFKFMTQTLRNEQQQNGKKNEGRQDTKMVYNKIFLKVAPFLFETGKETIHDIVNKFKEIEKDDELLGLYASIIDNINLGGEEYIETHCPHCDGEDTVDLTFPDWSKFFNKVIDSRGYFRNK